MIHLHLSDEGDGKWFEKGVKQTKKQPTFVSIRGGGLRFLLTNSAAMNLLPGGFKKHLHHDSCDHHQVNN